MADTVPQTAPQALTLALTLGITAPTEAKKEQAVAVAERIAQSLSASQVEACKSAALDAAGLSEQAQATTENIADRTLAESTKRALRKQNDPKKTRTKYRPWRLAGQTAPTDGIARPASTVRENPRQHRLRRFPRKPVHQRIGTAGRVMYWHPPALKYIMREVADSYPTTYKMVGRALLAQGFRISEADRLKRDDPWETYRMFLAILELMPPHIRPHRCYGDSRPWGEMDFSGILQELKDAAQQH